MIVESQSHRSVENAQHRYEIVPAKTLSCSQAQRLNQIRTETGIDTLLVLSAAQTEKNINNHHIIQHIRIEDRGGLQSTPLSDKDFNTVIREGDKIFAATTEGGVSVGASVYTTHLTKEADSHPSKLEKLTVGENTHDLLERINPLIKGFDTREKALQLLQNEQLAYSATTFVDYPEHNNKGLGIMLKIATLSDLIAHDVTHYFFRLFSIAGISVNIGEEWVSLFTFKKSIENRASYRLNKQAEFMGMTNMKRPLTFLNEESKTRARQIISSLIGLPAERVDLNDLALDINNIFFLRELEPELERFKERRRKKGLSKNIDINH